MSTSLAINRDLQLSLLRNVDAFRDLDDEMLGQIADTASYQEVSRGDFLLREGDVAATLFIVLKGRFVVLSDEGTIAEISMGEPVGELAFFAGGTRTASVMAARNSAVMCLTKTAYDRLAEHTPELSKGILRALSQRLVQTIVPRIDSSPRQGRICSVLPGGDGPMDPAFVQGLKQAFEGVRDWILMDETSHPSELHDNEAGLTAWIEDQDGESRNMVLLCSRAAGNEVWRKVIAENSDSVIIALEKTAVSGADVPISLPEADVLDGTLKSSVQLALYRPTSSEPTTHSSRWLAQRDVALHHHVALDSARDFARLGRFIRGEALGLVLCGSGSFGTAHLGVTLALQERGYEFDFIGGTSVGAALAGAMALQMPMQRIMDVCDALFVNSKAMSTLNLPKHGVLDHTMLDEALKAQFGRHAIEDMPINYFAMATSLTHNSEKVLTRGPLWEAVRASTSVPGVFPPFVTADGEVLIDGGIMNNAPINVMRDLKTGPNLILDVSPRKPWRAKTKYEDFPSRKQALRGFLRRKTDGAHAPTLLSVLSRTMVVNSRRTLQDAEIGHDVLMNVPTLPGMSFLDWTRGRELFGASREKMERALQIAEVNDHRRSGDPLSLLRAAADIINRADPAGQSAPV